MSKNIMVIFFDAHSRNALKEKMPLTSQFLRDFQGGREHYEFFKFHSILPYTLDNMAYYSYGVSNWN